MIKVNLAIKVIFLIFQRLIAYIKPIDSTFTKDGSNFLMPIFMHSHAYDKLVYFNSTLNAIKDEGKRFPIMCDNTSFHNNKGMLDGLSHTSAHEGIFSHD